VTGEGKGSEKKKQDKKKKKKDPPLSRPYSFKFQRYSQRSLFLINTSPSLLSLSHLYPT